MQRFALPLFGLVAFLLSACGPSVHYEKTYEISDPGWSYADTLDFSFTIADTNQIYNLFLEIEHQIDFPRENMYLQIHTQFPGGDRIEELVSLELAGKGGIWFGKCNSETCQIEIPIQQDAYFDRPGDYLVTLEQYTRINPLPGLNRIGFQVVETDARRSQ